MNTWQVFSTNLRRPNWILDKCISSWWPFYDYMFCWINGDITHSEVEKEIERLSTAILRTRTSHRTRPGGYKLRETPLSVGYSVGDYADIEDIDPPDVVMQFDDDEEIPSHGEFHNYYENWLQSDSRLMNCNWVYMWDEDFIRVDPFASQCSHGFFFKPPPGERFSWMPYGGGGRPKSMPRESGWECPYPVRHFSHTGEYARSVYLEDEKTGRQAKQPDYKRLSHYQVDPQRVVLKRWYPEITMDDIFKMQTDIRRGNIPKHCTEYTKKQMGTYESD